MEEIKQKEDIKLLSKKRKIEHDNLEEKEFGNNKDNIPEKDSEIQNLEIKSLNNLKPQELEQEKEKELIEEKINDDICSKCGLKSIIYFFKNGNDIYNYLLSKNFDNKEDIKKILEEKYRDKENKINKKLCENCINNLLSQEKDNFIKYIFDENEINSNNNIIKEIEKNENIELKEEIKQIVENKLIDNIDDISTEKKIEGDHNNINNNIENKNAMFKKVEIKKLNAKKINQGVIEMKRGKERDKSKLHNDMTKRMNSFMDLSSILNDNSNINYNNNNIKISRMWGDVSAIDKKDDDI